MKIITQIIARLPQTQRKSWQWSSLPSGLRQLIILGLLIAGWQAYVSVSKVQPALVSSPADVARAFWEDLLNLNLFKASVNTLQNLLFGLSIGLILGLGLAAFAVLSQFGRDLLSLLVAIFNPLPSIAILPLAMIWFGLTPTAIIFVIVHATTWPIALNVDNGFRTVSPTIGMVARNLGLGGWRLITGVLLPAALPHILTGLKSAWAFGWRTVVAAELVFGVAGENGGLGWYINNNRYFLNTANVFAGLVAISLMGIAVEFLFGYIERKTTVRWGMQKAR
jgi:NitT/TauT family transport system permease protein